MRGELHMSGAQRPRRPSTPIQLSPKQANIYTWGWQKDAPFRYAVCGRRFGKTYLGADKEMRHAPTAAWAVSCRSAGLRRRAPGVQEPRVNINLDGSRLGEAVAYHVARANQHVAAAALA